MDDIVLANQENRSLPPNSYAITFDDGFKNNLDFASPILKIRNAGHILCY